MQSSYSQKNLCKSCKISQQLNSAQLRQYARQQRGGSHAHQPHCLRSPALPMKQEPLQHHQIVLRHHHEHVSKFWHSHQSAMEYAHLRRTALPPKPAWRMGIHFSIDVLFHKRICCHFAHSIFKEVPDGVTYLALAANADQG